MPITVTTSNILVITTVPPTIFVRYVRLGNEYCLYMQMHLLLAALAFLTDTALWSYSGRQDSVLTWLADLLLSGNKLRAQDHAATELACLRWATATGQAENRTTPRAMMPIFGVYLHLYRRNVSKFVVGGVICGTMLFAKFPYVRFVKSTLKLKSNVRCGCSTRKRNEWLITIRQRHGHCLSILRHLRLIRYQWPWISKGSSEVADFDTNRKRDSLPIGLQ